MGAPPAPAPLPRPGWLRRRVRVARAHPGRTVLLLTSLVLLPGALALAGGRLYFDHHLRGARDELAAAATQHLLRCRAFRPDHPDVLLLAARVARRSGSWDEAQTFLDRYWDRYGDDDRLVFERLALRATRGEVEAAGPPLIARVEAGGPDAGVAREALISGLVYRFLWPEADRQLGFWLAAEPDATAALLLRGKLLEQRLQSREAALDYRRIVDLDPDHDEARLRLTTLLLQFRQGEEALRHLDVLRHRLPENSEVLTQWARALALQGRTEEARAAIDQCLRLHPDTPGALAEAGRYAYFDEDDAAAERILARAVRLDPGNAATRHQYLLVLTRAGKNAEAAAQEEAIRRLQKDNERIDHLIQGPLQTTPNDPAVHHEIAIMAFRAGRPEEAFRWLKTALQVGPDHLPTHQTLAGYYQDTGNPALAARHRALAQKLMGSKP
jgi:tetratricopeptide (TPR) repeat protein